MLCTFCSILFFFIKISYLEFVNKLTKYKKTVRARPLVNNKNITLFNKYNIHT